MFFNNNFKNSYAKEGIYDIELTEHVLTIKIM